MVKPKTGTIVIVLIAALLLLGSVSFVIAPEQQTAALGSIDVSNPVINIGEQVIVTGEVFSHSGGFFYVEAGLVESSRVPLAISLLSSRSACDGNKQYAGQFVTLIPDGRVPFKFLLSDYGVEGKYNLVIGVYRGCGNFLEVQGKQQIVYTEKVYPQSITVQKAPTTTTTQTTALSKPPGGTVSITSMTPSSGTKYVLGQSVIVKGTFTASGPGRYLIESGVTPITSFQSFSLVADRSLCDANPTYASQFFTAATAGQKTDFTYTITPEIVGKHKVSTYVTNGCENGAQGSPATIVYYGAPISQEINVVASTSVPSEPTGGQVAEKACEAGSTKEVGCADQNPGSVGGPIVYECSNSQYVYKSGECNFPPTDTTGTELLPVSQAESHPQSESQQSCKPYQEFADGSCSFNLKKFGTNAGLSSFLKTYAILLIIVFAIMIFLFFTPKGKTLIKKIRR